MQTLNITKKYEKYPEYKNSGVEWLGKIPKEWEAQRIVSIFDFPHDKVTEENFEYQMFKVLPKIDEYLKNIDFELKVL